MKVEKFHFIPSLEPFELDGLGGQWRYVSFYPRNEAPTAYPGDFEKGSFRVAIQECFDQADFEGAIEQCAAAIERSEDFEPYYNRAIAYTTQGRLDEALDDFRNVLEIDPANRDALLHRANIFMSRRKYEDSLRTLNLMLKLYPKDVEGFELKGEVNFNRGQKEKAIQDFLAAIEINPKNPELHKSLGFIYEIMSRYEEAIESYSAAISLDNENWHHYFRRACVYMQIADLDAAESDLSNVIAINPNSYVSFGRRGRIRVQKGHVELAVKDLKRGCHSFINLNARGLAYLQLDKLDEALKCFQDAKADLTQRAGNWFRGTPPSEQYSTTVSKLEENIRLAKEAIGENKRD